MSHPISAGEGTLKTSPFCLLTLSAHVHAQSTDSSLHTFLTSVRVTFITHCCPCVQSIASSWSCDIYNTFFPMCSEHRQQLELSEQRQQWDVQDQAFREEARRLQAHHLAEVASLNQEVSGGCLIKASGEWSRTRFSRRKHAGDRLTSLWRLPHRIKR